LKPTDTAKVGANASKPTLSPLEKSLASGKRGLVDTKAQELVEWINARQLTREEPEGEIDYARRMFVAIVQDFEYEFTNNMDWRLNYICSRRKSDCGGLCLVFVSALRRAGIPARVLVGRWAKSAEVDEKLAGKKYFQSHVKAEFFAQGVGWVPVDLAMAVVHDKRSDGLNYFGNDSRRFSHPPRRPRVRTRHISFWHGSSPVVERRLPVLGLRSRHGWQPQDLRELDRRKA
jgi:hypothetical protein